MAFSFQTRANLCYEERISVREVFDFKTGETLENISSANSIPPEFLLPPFLAACGHFLGQSVVCPWGTWKQPAIISSTTVGFTGTNKYAAMDVIKEAIKEVESTQGLSFQNSRINQCNTAITSPVLNVTRMSHPGEICKKLDEERKTSDNNDGLYSRFLICMPQPVFSFADEVQDLKEDLPSLAKLFYVVEKLHEHLLTHTEPKD